MGSPQSTEIFRKKTPLGDSVAHQPVLTAEKVSQSQESAAKPVTEMGSTGHTDAQGTPQNLLENCLMEILWVQNEVHLLKRRVPQEKYPTCAP